MWGRRTQVEFSLAENAVMILVCVVSFVLTVAGVARQRRGDAVAIVPRAAGSAGYPDWLGQLVPVPVSHLVSDEGAGVVRAQVQRAAHPDDRPGVAVLIFLLFAISIPVRDRPPRCRCSVDDRPDPCCCYFGGNAFGIRRNRDALYASAFEATQPYGTAQLAGLKVLVRTTCVLAALIAVGVSLWASSSLVGAWGSWLVEGGKDAVPELLKKRQVSQTSSADRRRMHSPRWRSSRPWPSPS